MFSFFLILICHNEKLLLLLLCFQQPLRAMGHDWHPECFNCDKCRVPLSPDNFLEKNGRPYCPNCFDKLFMPKCYGCSKPIKGTVSFFSFYF